MNFSIISAFFVCHIRWMCIIHKYSFLHLNCLCFLTPQRIKQCYFEYLLCFLYSSLFQVFVKLQDSQFWNWQLDPVSTTNMNICKNKHIILIFTLSNVCNFFVAMVTLLLILSLSFCNSSKSSWYRDLNFSVVAALLLRPSMHSSASPIRAWGENKID